MSKALQLGASLGPTTLLLALAGALAGAGIAMVHLWLCARAAAGASTPRGWSSWLGGFTLRVAVTGGLLFALVAGNRTAGFAALGGFILAQRIGLRRTRPTLTKQVRP